MNDAEQMKAHWAEQEARALAAAQVEELKRFDPNDPKKAFKAIFDENLDLMLRKQRDYGNGNIETFGTAGVLVRLADKFARLRNLTGKDQAPATDESLEDTWKDIINYGLIGLCLQRGWVYHPVKDYVLKERA